MEVSIAASAAEIELEDISMQSISIAKAKELQDIIRGDDIFRSEVATMANDFQLHASRDSNINIVATCAQSTN